MLRANCCVIVLVPLIFPPEKMESLTAPNILITLKPWCLRKDLSSKAINALVRCLGIFLMLTVSLLLLAKTVSSSLPWSSYIVVLSESRELILDGSILGAFEITEYTYPNTASADITNIIRRAIKTILSLGCLLFLGALLRRFAAAAVSFFTFACILQKFLSIKYIKIKANYTISIL